MRKPKHRRILENQTKRKTRRNPAAETFEREDRKIVYRTATGRFTKKGRRGARRFVVRSLFVRSESGKIRRYGSIRESTKTRAVRLVNEERVSQGVFIKGVLEKNDIAGKIKRERARGVMVTVRGRAGGKDRIIKTRIIIDPKKLKDAGYLHSIISGRVQAKLKGERLRLSSKRKENKTKGSKRLHSVTFSTSFFF